MGSDKIESLRFKLTDLLKEKDLDFKEIKKISTSLAKFDTKFQNFHVDAKTIIQLGRDSIKDHTTALIELVKNCYDADAKVVDVVVFSKGQDNQIRVADNGFGMTKDELLNYWLRIGFSSKRKSKISEMGRRKTGEKGIGRISTDRLGAKIKLITKTKKDGIIGISVNWDDFDIEGKEISDINVELIYPKTINLPLSNGQNSETGTEIIITELRQNWTKSNIENLYYELSALTPPFNDLIDFELSLQNDIAPDYSKKIESDYFKASTIELTAVIDDKKNEILYTYKDKYSKKEITEFIKWERLIQKSYSANLPDVEKKPRCGPVTIKLLFFLRDSTSIQGQKFSLSDLREFLDVNSGVKLYRDNIAVKPYGFPSSKVGYDWLGLAERKADDPAGVGREGGGRIVPSQLVGGIFISRDDNSFLTDSSSREGLVESEAFYDLKHFVLGSIIMLESYRAKIQYKIEGDRNTKKSQVSKDAEQIKFQFSSVTEELNSIVKDIEESSYSNSSSKFSSVPLEKSIEKVTSIANKVDKTLLELLNWNRVLSGLATIGISSTVFGHETEGSISLFRKATTNAKDLIKEAPPNIELALTELDKGLKHSKKVASWGAYALTRVQKEKRSRKIVNIKHTIEAIVKELKPAFEASSIKLSINAENLVSRTFQMDIESILINLLTNAYTACTQKSGERKVNINLIREDVKADKGYSFTVSDTGHGIAKEHQHRIFEPLFSTKTVSSGGSKSIGTGLGLTVVKSLVDELGGNITFENCKELNGAKFKIWLPKL